MAGGSYIDPYPRNEPCEEHTENLAIICPSGTTCFGEPASDFIQRVCEDAKDHGDTIKTRENDSAIELLQQSCPSRGSPRENQRDAERKLLTHSLWLIDHQTILDDEFWGPLSYQLRNLPDESKVYTWVKNDQDNFEDTKRDIDSQFINVNIATSKGELEDWVSGYIGFQVNPNGGEQTVIEWSHKVAKRIDGIN